MEPAAAKSKLVKPRVKKTEVTVQVRPANKIYLRSIRWAHLGLRKPNPAEITAIRYHLHSGLDFTTTLTVKTDTTEMEPDVTTYYEDLASSVGDFKLSFLASNQRFADFDLMALLGERGEVLYLYEF